MSHGYPILGVLVPTPSCSRSTRHWQHDDCRSLAAWQQASRHLRPEGNAAACSIRFREDVCRDCPRAREHPLPGDLPAGEVGRGELGDLEPRHPWISGPRELVTPDR